jgi:hypothetical protein
VLESRALAFRDVQWREAPWPWNLYPVCPRGADSGND